MKNNSSFQTVRLVRCPRCTEVLPEPNDVPFYRCGGCDTVLQAKHYKKANEGKTVPEGSSSVQNNREEYGAQTGVASSSNLPHFMDPNVEINQRNAENGNLEQPGVSNSSRDSTSSQPKQQPPPSYAQHFLHQNEKMQQNPEGPNALGGDSSQNEHSSPSHEVPSSLVPETREIKGDHSPVEQSRGSAASSSNESMEQLAQPVLEKGEVRLDTTLSEATTARIGGETNELNQNVSRNCRLEKVGVTNFPSEALLSNESRLHETYNSSQVAAEDGQVEKSSTKVKEQPELSNFSSEPTLSNEHTIGQDEPQLGSPNEEVMKIDEQFASKSRQWQPVSEVKQECEVSSTNEAVFILKRNDSSSQFPTANEEGQVNNVVEICSRDADVYYNTVTSSQKSAFHENKDLSQLVTQNQDVDEGTIQSELGISNEDESAVVLPESAKLPDESATESPESVKTSGSINSFESEVSTAPYEYGNSRHPAEAHGLTDGTSRVPALPTLKPSMEAELLNLDDRSQKTVKTNPTVKSKEEEKPTEATKVASDHFKAGTSYRDLPKSPTRSSFAYDGSVSSYDGNDDQVVYQLPSETMQRINKNENPAAEDRRQYLSGGSKTSSGSTFQHKMDNVQVVSPGDDCQPEEENTPVMLNEIKMSEVLSDAPYRRNRTRPRTQEFLSRAPLYRRSPVTRYRSSGHLVHREFYNHPMYYLPHHSRDVESRVTRRYSHRNHVDGNTISEAVWMGEEFQMYPYHESSSEIYPYPRDQMYYGGRRQIECQPVARVPYSGETVRSGYRVLDSYSHLYPPGVSYGRGWYGPREPFDSYTDSDYYSRSHDTISEDQRHTNQRMSRLQLRRNLQPVQHFQPIGGAAPFITCYHCLELLQLPSDFLLFKEKRIHRVKCSACSTILKFTLEKGCHLVPYVPNSREDASADRILKSASTSQANHKIEAFHRRSASGSVYAAGNSQVSLHSCSQAPERPKSKFETKHSQDKGKSVMVEMHEHNNAAGSSSPDTPRPAKVTWKLPDKSSSPLHRLMGYSSPSAVLYRHGSDDLETED